MYAIEKIHAMEILDSRGRPTVKAAIALKSGASASASVPSGASTGSAEAIELRDGDAARYGGLGCRKAVANVNGEIAGRLAGKRFEKQADLDQAMIDLDGTANKGRLGANGILAVSIAFARACAVARGVELYEHFGEMVGRTRASSLPRLTVNLFSGGKHAGNIGPAVQDILLVPATAKTIDEGLATVYAVYQSAVKLIRKKYGVGPLTADEGGLAPPVQTAEELLDNAVAAIQQAGYTPGRDVALAVDVASTHFFTHARYHLSESRSLTSAQMIEHLQQWVEKYPIVSLEDGLAEDDWPNWPKLRQAIAHKSLVVGDDLLCTNPERICTAVAAHAANTLLLKVNQIGTLTQAAQAANLARSAGWRVTISARSGETEDNWLADLAVGWAADQIKVGSITQSERLAKYNRLLEIEAATHFPVVNWPG